MPAEKSVSPAAALARPRAQGPSGSEPSAATVMRDWKHARLWLRRQLDG